MKAIRVLIADEYLVARVGLKKLLYSNGILVVGEADRLQDIAICIHTYRPRVVVVSAIFSTSYDDLVHVIQQLKAELGSRRIWIVAIADDALFQPLLDAGADEVLSLHLTKRSLHSAVRNCLIHSGKEPPKISRAAVALQRQTKLYDFIVQHFNLNELEGLCFEMGVTVDEIQGDNLSSKARNLILWCRRRSRMNEMERLSRKLRPNVDQ